MLYTICFKCYQSLDFSDEEIVQSLQKRRFRNTFQNITGLSLNIGEVFIEVMEGDQAILKAMLKRMIQSREFDNFKVLMIGPVSSRYFKKWNFAMGLQSNVEMGELQRLNKDYKFNLDAELFSSNHPHFGVEILKSFYENKSLDYRKFWSEAA